jgi:hypothetical protein
VAVDHHQAVGHALPLLIKERSVEFLVASVVLDSAFGASALPPRSAP